MNFNDLYKRIYNIDKGLNEYGEPMGPMISNQPSTPPPSMSVNLNAQGMDNIASLMNLFTKVNPDMMPVGGLPPTPSLSDPSMSRAATLQLTPPMGADANDVAALNTHDMGDDKMDLDIDGDDVPDIAIGSKDKSMGLPPGHDKDHAMIKMLDKDGDGDHDMDDHDEEKSAYANMPDEKYADIDDITTKAGGGMNGPKNPKDLRVKDPSPYENMEYANSPDEHTDDHLRIIRHLAGGMNKEKPMVKHSYKQGDNPMAMPESEDPLESIRNDLRSRLQNYKAQ